MPRSTGPNRWEWAAIGCITLVVAATNAVRYVVPVGEKYVPFMQPGAADFSYPFNGARALLLGLDPYSSDDPRLADPWHREQVVDGRTLHQYYPPTHLLLYVPLVLAANGDARVAGRIWFCIGLLALVALTLVVGWLLARLEPPGEGWPGWGPLLPFVFLTLTLNAGVSLGLERGQSDLASALLCWSAVVLAVRGRIGFAVALATTATLIKGYPALLTLGLVFLVPGRAAFARGAAGAGAAVLLLLAPVARYLPEAAAAMRYRAGWVSHQWLNHGFLNLGYALAPEWAVVGRYALTAIALAAAALCWLQARRSLRVASPDAALWTALFASTSLGAVLGYSSYSAAYNLVLVLPGVYVFALAQHRLAGALGLDAREERALGIGIVTVVFCLFVYKLRSNYFPVASLGLAAFVAAAGACAFGVLRRGAPANA